MTNSTVTAAMRNFWDKLKVCPLKEKILLGYLLSMLIISVYVPCNAVHESADGKFLKPLGYMFLWSVPAIYERSWFWIVYIDLPQIGLEMVALTALLAISLVLLRVHEAG